MEYRRTFGYRDLDSSVFLLGADSKVTDGGDDEEIKVDLSKVPANVEKIDFTVTIYDADARKQNFGQVENAFIRVFDELNGKEPIRYDLDEDFSIENAVIVGELYRNKGEWKFNAVGSDFEGGPAASGNHFVISI